MFVELLVASTCIQAKGGCTESVAAYSVYNKDVEAISRNIQSYGEKIVKGNEWVVYVVTPMYAIASGNAAEFSVRRNTTLLVNVKEKNVYLQWSY